jgi:ribokinase
MLGRMPIPIAVLGSLMMDLVVRAPRLPVRGETLFGHDFAMFVGGKGGNQAIAAARLGASPVTMIGRVGADPFGDRVIETLESDGVDCRFLALDAEAGTGVALPMVFDDGGNSIVSVPRANMRVTVAQVEAAAAAITSAAMLLLQFEVPAEANIVAARLARRAGVPVLLNAAPVGEFPPELWSLASCLVVNEVEASAFATTAEPDADPLVQARELLGRGPAVVVVTLGDQGSVLATGDAIERIPAFPVDAVDSVGAGDAFCAAFALALAEGQSTASAARFASAAGAISATRPGAAASLPFRAEVEALVARGP